MSTNTPAELAPVIEEIASQWDGCTYDAPGETIDIGDAIRRAGKRLMAAVPSDAPALTLTRPQVEALREVIRISDRKHEAWDTIKSALSHQPAAAPKEEALAGQEVHGEGSFIYVLNNARRRSNRWCLSVQPGHDDSGKRISDEECRRIAQAIRAALSAAPAQAALTDEQIDAKAASDWGQQHTHRIGFREGARWARDALSAAPQVPQQEQAAGTAAGQAESSVLKRVACLAGSTVTMEVVERDGQRGTCVCDLIEGYTPFIGDRLVLATQQPSQPADSGQALRAALRIFDWLEVRSIYQDAEVKSAHDLVRAALASTSQAAQPMSQALIEALQFYADGEHFIKHEPNAWDTVSGEPPNYWEDEAGTATIEDGSIARLALEAHRTATTPSPPAAPVEQDDAQRACFENFFSWSRTGRGAQHREKQLLRNSDGTYCDDHTQRHWWTWQQAVASAAPQGGQEAADVARILQSRIGATRDHSGLRQDDKRLWDKCQRVIDGAPQPSAVKVPEGWKLVPVEPTDSMVAAGAVIAINSTHESEVRDAWAAMLAAAPSQGEAS